MARDGFARLSGANIGFIGNHTSRLNDNSLTLHAFLKSNQFSVKRVFSPEHGARGVYDDDVLDEQDHSTGLTVVSLFGKYHKPTKEMLEGIDILVFELQDVGARFYTYTATLLGAIDAAAEHGIRLIVLDRPNPITGVMFEGPTVDLENYSFVAPYSLPVRTGLTLGELAILYAKEKGIEKTVEAAPMEGWDRSTYFDDSHYQWNPPSPAMKSLSTAIVYPGVCLLEQTNISVGRGTPLPFEILGAPFVDGVRLAQRINDEEHTGVHVLPETFIPIASKFAGQKCHGIRIVVTNRSVFHPVRFGVSLLSIMYKLYPAEANIMGCRTLLANEETLSMIIQGTATQTIEQSWKQTLSNWQYRRRSCLLY
jgi:uncharacterized protein YbbC (DUF1343 family)